MLKSYSFVMHVRGTNAPHTTQKKILENTTLMETETCTRQHILDQHDKSQSHHDLLKLHLVSKNLREKKTGGSSLHLLLYLLKQNLTHFEFEFLLVHST